jgi:hypothetical protein
MDAAKQRCALGVGEDMQRRTPSGCDYFNLFFHDFFNKIYISHFKIYTTTVV